MSPHSRSRRPVRLLRLAVTVPLVLGGLTAASPVGSPAATLFQAASDVLLHDYYGWSDTDRTALVAQYHAALDSACADAQDTCTFDQGRKVVSDMLGQLHDPHTNIRDAEGAERLREIQNDLTVLRTGLQVVKTPLGLLVVGILPNSPGLKAGVQRFDLLTQVNGQQAGTDQKVDAAGFVRLERRAAPMVLQLTRAGQPSRVLTLTPAPMKAGDVPTLTVQNSPAGKVAVIQYPTFLADNSADLFLKSLREAQRQGAGGLVIDLRYNGGGSLEQCVRAASAFLPTVYQARWAQNRWEYAALDGDKTSPARARGAAPDDRLWTGKVAVLVGQNTASCAEVFGYFAHRAGAVVVGEPTKGVMNSGVTFVPLPDQGVMSVTVLRAYDAAGEPLPSHLDPDISAPTDVKELTTSGQDTALQTAIETVQAQSAGADSVSGK
ncbi:S41 family peptidase [Deinococcus ruber]|uniref:S41 family peptidase n=1 Tax=Deinococcus ruber TaxID=1848197 RepID=UPI001E58AD8B|nr:S41 family peptidase [Deinococcus ruber]